MANHFCATCSNLQNTNNVSNNIQNTIVENTASAWTLKSNWTNLQIIIHKNPLNIDNPYIKGLVNWYLVQGQESTPYHWDLRDKKNTIIKYCFINNTDRESSINITDFDYMAAGIRSDNPTDNLLDWNDAEKVAFKKGLELYANLIGVGIREVSAANYKDADLKEFIAQDRGGGETGLLGMHTVGASPACCGIFYRKNNMAWSDSLVPGGTGFQTIIHEIGHALGLSHPHDGFLFPNVQGSRSFGDNNLNTSLYTIMSYNKMYHNDKTIARDSWPASPMAFDIAAIDFIYGLNPIFNSGNNTYIITDGPRFNTTKSIVEINGFAYWQYWRDSITGKGITRCIYDVGGKDIIIYNGSSKVVINLSPATIKNEKGGGGFLSYLDEDTPIEWLRGGGYTIAKGTIIENATGGSNDDTFHQVDNVSNIIDGRLGFDHVIYSDEIINYNIVKLNDSYVKVSGAAPSIGNATDHLYNIEKLKFKDVEILTKFLPNPFKKKKTSRGLFCLVSN